MRFRVYVSEPKSVKAVQAFTSTKEAAEHWATKMIEADEKLVITIEECIWKRIETVSKEGIRQK